MNHWCHHLPASSFYLLIYFWWYNKQEIVSHETELISYLTACKTHVGDKGLTFWNATAAFPSLIGLLFAQDLLSAPASQAYVERVFSVCGHLTSGKRNRLYKKLANWAFLRMNTKFYDWLYFIIHCIWIWLCWLFIWAAAVMLLCLGVKAVLGYRISWETMKKVSKNSNRQGYFSEFTLPMFTSETRMKKL